MIIGSSDYSAACYKGYFQIPYLGVEGIMKGHVPVAVRLLVAWKPQPQPASKTT
jgi:hypothetical protein